MREGETIIQSTALRETEQKDFLPISDFFAHQAVDHFEQPAMMHRHRLFRVKIGEPTKSITQWPAFLFRFAQMLMRSLQSRERETFGHDHLRLTQRVPLARAITVKRNQQRRGRRIRRNDVVTKYDLRRERAFNDWIVHRAELIARNTKVSEPRAVATGSRRVLRHDQAPPYETCWLIRSQPLSALTRLCIRFDWRLR